jgi:hypothetical protein
MLVFGTLPGVCFSEGMTSYLYSHNVRIFDYARFAEPFRNELRESAERLAAECGLKIDHIRKKNSRNESQVRKVLAERGNQPGLVWIFSAMERCQVHKRRNVLDHLTDEQRPAVATKLNAAYALENYANAKHALNLLHREMMDLNPSDLDRASSVRPTQLRKTLASTNVIESAFSIVEQVCKNVKRWHGGDQRERWVGSGLLVAQKQVPSHRAQTDSGSHQRVGSVGAAQARSCQAEKGVAEWVTR